MNVELKNPGSVFLIGFRCTGKSSVGRLLAAKLGWAFVDTDTLLVSESRMSIKEIVGGYGWQTFRKMEQDVVEQVCLLDRRVVATGGGVVLSEANVNLMKKSGRLVWLKALPETIKARMMLDPASEAFRPTLSSKDRLAEIEETLIERDPVYRQAMDFSVDTDGRQIDEICDTILEQLNSSALKISLDRS
jgi:shikimate kinase